jgi:pyruvate formate lyase activating enzyme
MPLGLEPHLTSEHTGVVPTRYWHRVDRGKVQCDLCPRACKLNKGRRGLCFVRGRLDDEIVLTSYGRSSGFAIDPIEKNRSTISFPVHPFSPLALLVVT